MTKICKLLSLMFLTVLFLSFNSCSIIAKSLKTSTTTTKLQECTDNEYDTPFEIRVKLHVMQINLWAEVSNRIEYEATI